MNIQHEFDKLHHEIRSLRHQVSALKKEVAFGTRDTFAEQDQWLVNARNSHHGERCFLLGCGPSLNQVDLSKLKGERVMACNGSFLIEGLDIDYFISVSHYFYKSYVDQINSIDCIRRFLPHYLRELESDIPTTWMNTVEDSEYATLSQLKPYAFSSAPDRHIFLGGTVIFPALQILHYLGFEEVILLGVDHNYGPDEKRNEAYFTPSDALNAHFKDDYYQKPTSVHIDFPAMERGYQLSKEAFENSGRRIFNATPGTKLETYQKIEFDSLF